MHCSRDALHSHCSSPPGGAFHMALSSWIKRLLEQDLLEMEHDAFFLQYFNLHHVRGLRKRGLRNSALEMSTVPMQI